MLKGPSRKNFVHNVHAPFGRYKLYVIKMTFSVKIIY